MKKTAIGFLLAALILVTGCGDYFSGPLKTDPPMVSTAPIQSPMATNNKPLPTLTLEKYDGGFFSLSKPEGWEVVTAGACSTFAFCARDTANPANQVFYFGEVGPVYLAEEQKEIDKNYMDMGGYPVQWYETPVIDPLTPENFLESWHLIAETELAAAFMQGFPRFNDIEIISVTEEESFLPGAPSKTIRALFREGGQLGEGLFLITTAPLIALTGMPSGGIGYGYCITGITAERENFKFYEAQLRESLNSLTFSQQYIDDCLEAQRRQGAALLDIGKTLSEISDIIMETWENRNRSDDIMAEKRSDAILGYERVYDPETGTVYSVSPGFYDSYNANRGQYDMGNLQLLPDNDWGLWTAPTEPGSEIK